MLLLVPTEIDEEASQKSAGKSKQDPVPRPSGSSTRTSSKRRIHRCKQCEFTGDNKVLGINNIQYHEPSCFTFPDQCCPQLKNCVKPIFLKVYLIKKSICGNNLGGNRPLLLDFICCTVIDRHFKHAITLLPLDSARECETAVIRLQVTVLLCFMIDGALETR